MEVDQRVDDRIMHDRKSLALMFRRLAERLISISNMLESDKPHAELCINELGEIQSEGTIIDASCGKLMGKIEVFGLMRIP